MGKKRRAEDDSDDHFIDTKRFRPEEYDSDESLHLPEHIFDDSLHGVNSPRSLDDDIIREKHKSKSKKERKKSRVSFMLDNDAFSDCDSINDERIPQFLKSSSSHVKSDVRNDQNTSGVSEVPRHTQPLYSKQEPVEEEVANGCISRNLTTLAETGKHIIYLIRKPTEVSLSDLEAVKLPKDELGKKKKKINTSEGKFTMKLYDMKQQMIHVPATTLMTAKDSKMIKPAGILSGFVTVTRTQPTLPGGPVYEESELPSNLVVELPISGIRKEPNLNMGNLKQRLKAFGVKAKSRNAKH